MDIQQTVIRELSAVMRENGVTPPPDLGLDSPLLKLGLDSLGYAVVVSRLEATLGYDPFVLMEEAVYPRTLGELVAIYERFRDRAG